MFIKKIIFLLLIFFILGCNEKTSYSGLILKDNLILTAFKNKEELLNTIGKPNYIDPIENNYYYFTEKFYSTNLLNKEIVDRNIVVFSFDEDNVILSTKQFNLDDEKKFTISKDKTKNNLIKKGLIEKVFGGIGTQTKLPNTSQ